MTNERNEKNAQEWLDEKYDKEGRNKIKKIELENKVDIILKGEVDLRNFSSLEEINLSDNLLTRINIEGLSKLKKIFLAKNLINQELEIFSNCYDLTELDLGFTAIDKDTAEKSQGSPNNNFTGSLTNLTLLKNLEKLEIPFQKNIKGGLNNLPKKKLVQLNVLGTEFHEKLLMYGGFELWKEADKDEEEKVEKFETEKKSIIKTMEKLVYDRSKKEERQFEFINKSLIESLETKIKELTEENSGIKDLQDISLSKSKSFCWSLGLNEVSNKIGAENTMVGSLIVVPFFCILSGWIIKSFFTKNNKIYHVYETGLAMNKNNSKPSFSTNKARKL